MNKKVISIKNEKTKLPLNLIALAYLLLDKFNAVGWVKGIVWTLIVLVLIGCLHNIWIEEEVDIFKPKDNHGIK